MPPTGTMANRPMACGADTRWQTTDRNHFVKIKHNLASFITATCPFMLPYNGAHALHRNNDDRHNWFLLPIGHRRRRQRDPSNRQMKNEHND